MLLPKNLAVVLSVMLLVTWASMVATKYLYYSGMSTWAIAIAGIAFVIIIVLVFWMRFTVKVFDDRVELTYILRTATIPKEEIIDTRYGELNVIKNYANWNIKGVKYRTYSVIGEELGVGLKVTGKRVFFFSCSDPDAVAALLPKEE